MRSDTQSAPPRSIERGWLEYGDIICPAAAVASTPDSVLALLRLAFYGGAAHALGELQAGSENDWARTVEALAREVLDDEDCLVLSALAAGSHPS